MREGINKDQRTLTYPFGIAFVQRDAHSEASTANWIEEAGRFSGVKTTLRVDHSWKILRRSKFYGHLFGAASQSYAIVAFGGCTYLHVFRQVLLPNFLYNHTIRSMVKRRSFKNTQLYYEACSLSKIRSNIKKKKKKQSNGENFYYWYNTCICISTLFFHIITIFF